MAYPTMARTDLEKARAVRKYLKEEFPACLVVHRKGGDVKARTLTWNFRVSSEGVFHIARICHSVWINHDASSLYGYLKRISLANLLRKNPSKSVLFTKEM